MKRFVAAAIASLIAGGAAAQQACEGVRERAVQVRTELEARVKQKPTPSAENAAAALLAGELELAAWLGLRVAEAAWNGKTATDAGIYLQYLDRRADALRVLGCAHAMGYRSPHLFEALASVHKAERRDGEAREAIAEAQRLAPTDPLIYAAAALIETGKPPPESKPEANDAPARCVAGLESHSRRVLALRKQNHLRHDRLQHADHRQKAFAGEAQIHQDLIKNVREVAANARRSGDAMQYNTALAHCASAYFMLTNFLLDSYYFAELAAELVFWADALRLDAPLFVRDLPCGSPGNTCDERSARSLSLLSRQVEDRLHFGREEAARQYRRDRDACAGSGPSCVVRAQARECTTVKALIEQWAASRQQRVNTARLNFDNASRYVISLGEAEIGAAREFAVDALRGVRKGGPSFTGPDGKPFNAVSFAEQYTNQSYLTQLLQSHLLAGGKVEQFLQQQSRWFGMEREGIEGSIRGAKQSHDSQCEPVMLELALLVLQEQYQDYLEHLRDRMRWGIDSRVDTKFPCDFSIGGLSGQADLNDLGEGKFGYKVTRGPYSGSASATSEGLAFSGSASGKIRGVGVSVDSQGKAGAGGRFGPFAGKADASFTSAVSPWNGREYLGIRVRGSAGFGVGTKGGGASASCYPSSGEVVIYPRALVEGMAAILSAKR